MPQHGHRWTPIRCEQAIFFARVKVGEELPLLLLEGFEC
jgi:hypothetical protein